MTTEEDAIDRLTDLDPLDLAHEVSIAISPGVPLTRAHWEEIDCKAAGLRELAEQVQSAAREVLKEGAASWPRRP